MDVRALQRGLAFFVLALGLFVAVDSLRLVVIRPWIFDPAWTRFQGFGGGATSVGLALLILLPQGHRARPWTWAGFGVALGYVVLVLIARWSYPA